MNDYPLETRSNVQAAYAAGVASRNDLARQCADLHDRLAERAKEISALEDHLAFVSGQRISLQLRIDDAEPVIAAAREFLGAADGPRAESARIVRLAEALRAHDRSRAGFRNDDPTPEEMRRFAHLLEQQADRAEAEAAE